MGALERDIRRNGSVSDQVNLTAFAVLALRAAGAAPPAATLGWLVRQQDSDGGFNFAVRGGRATPTTPAPRSRRWPRAAGRPAAHARARAIRFLRGQQDADGGFASLPGAGSNAQSTAFAVQGLLAAGVDPSSVRRRGASPLDYLRSLIAADGHVRYSRGTDQTPGVGDRRGADGARRQAAAARAGGAPERAGSGGGSSDPRAQQPRVAPADAAPGGCAAPAAPAAIAARSPRPGAPVPAAIGQPTGRRAGSAGQRRGHPHRGAARRRSGRAESVAA